MDSVLQVASHANKFILGNMVFFHLTPLGQYSTFDPLHAYYALDSSI